MSVFIVNFGHAQMIEDARSYVGTRGFTDPEVVADEEAHSTTSETFGKMLEHVAKAAGDTVIIKLFQALRKGRRKSVGRYRQPYKLSQARSRRPASASARSPDVLLSGCS